MDSIDTDVLPRAAELQRVFDTISGGLLVMDADGRISMCNKEFRRYFGVPDGHDDWVGVDAHTAVDTLARQMSDPAAFRERMIELAEHTVFVYEHVTAADGRVFERDYLPMLDNSSYCGQVWHYWDVTEQRVAALDRERRLRAELIAQRLGVHAQRVRAAEAERTGLDLAERNRALVETDVLRQELVATASHELRTPLTTILSFSEMLVDEPVDSDDIAVYSAAITRNASRLLVVVDDLLLLARIGSGAAVLAGEPVDVSALLADAAQDASATVPIESDIAGGLTVIGDRLARARAVGNVLGNAIKYSRPGGVIRVGARRSGAAVSITVRDEGIGIPDDELEAVFGQFYRATTARDSGRPGTGLGLSIVRSILEQHDATIALDSAVGVGTTVRITLPAG